MTKAWLTATFLLLLWPIAACAPADARGLRIATWNIQHLTERAGDGCHPRTEADYIALRRYADRLDADVIALQEIESAAAAGRVFDPARYRIVMETRPPVPRRLCNPALPNLIRTPLMVGFAVRRDLAFTRNPDLAALGLGDPDQAWGVDITVRKGDGRPLRLLAVHLRSGCSDGVTRPACVDLFRQQAVLSRWIADRAAAGEAFALAGDFNRVIRSGHDAFFRGLTGDGRYRLQRVTDGRQSHCPAARRPFIDQILLGGAADRRGLNFTEALYPSKGHPLSDHCAIRVDLRG